MKISNQLLFSFMLASASIAYSQEGSKRNMPEPTNLNLKDAIDLAINKSNEATLANTKAESKNLEWQAVKNNQYPDVKISAEYMRLTNANIDLKLNT